MPHQILATFADVGRMAVEVLTGSGHELLLDAGGDEGAGGGPGPKEALLAALAGCTSMDVATILRKKRQRPTGYQIAVSGDSATEHPRVFVRISVEHRVSGAVEVEALRRSIELSATRYCPVSAMLSASVRIEHRYRLLREGEPARSELVVVTGPR
ncbi:MAG: OsmC family protein [Chloroflexota bacterium]|nr:OsmC family protein [Chloroflexota bacterium]